MNELNRAKTPKNESYLLRSEWKNRNRWAPGLQGAAFKGRTGRATKCKLLLLTISEDQQVKEVPEQKATHSALKKPVIKGRKNRKRAASAKPSLKQTPKKLKMREREEEDWYEDPTGGRLREGKGRVICERESE